MARQLIAGATPADALPRLERCWRAGEASTVDLLGEKTVTEAEAARYAARVEELLEVLVAGTRTWPPAQHLEHDPWGGVPRVNVSVKPTALSPRFAPTTAEEGIAEARARLLPILRRAREAGATIHLDMEHDDAKDATLALLRALGAEFPDGPQLGCVIQAYRTDAFRDLCDVVAWSERTLRIPLAVRLVKGAYWDYETVVAAAEGWPVPVFQAKAETDASYERCVPEHRVRRRVHASARAPGRGDRVPAPLRDGRADPRGPRPAWIPGPRVCACRRSRRWHGVSRAPPAREHVERVVHPPALRRGTDARCPRRAARRRAAAGAGGGG
jgi:hypothetical protein